jgi:hypothetical protein
MSSKKGNIIEKFIDKAVLAIAVLISLGILFVFVIGSPKIEYAGGNYGPSEIDDVINKRAIKLQDQLKGEPNKAVQYKPQKPQYLSEMKDPVSKVDTNIQFPLPEFLSKPAISHRVYQIPKMPLIEKPSIAMVPMAAFVPTEDLSATVTYKTVETKLEDIDLVTVESSVNVKQLYSDFQESFAGKGVRESWRNDQYAKPVFAQVELQRKTLQSNGTWSDWTEVPRTKICPLKKELQIPQKASEYEMEISLVQFAKSEFRNEVLQPPVYYNAIPAQWLSPSFYNEWQKEITKQQEDVRRQEVEAEKAKKLQEKAVQPTRQPAQSLRTPAGAAPRTPAAGAAPRTPAGAGAASRTPNPRLPAAPKPVEKPAAKPDKNISAPEQTRPINEDAKFDAIKLAPTTNLGDLDKLIFWAHDDTTQPGEKYRYRIRIGVFNPVAGRGWVSADQNDLRDQVVLWGNFADVNEVVEIPERLHFFATNMREVVKGNNVDRTVEVMVARYMLGNWVSHTFSVRNGEEIGKVIEATDPRLEKAGISGDTIDFSTNAVMVDVRKVSDWTGSGSLRQREYYELLFSRDGKTIEKMAIKDKLWPAKIAKTFKEISDALAAEPVTLMSWTQASSGTQQIQQRGTRQDSAPVRPEPGQGQSQPPGTPIRK